MTSPPHHPLSGESLRSRFGERYKWLVMSVVATGTVAAVLLSTSFSIAVPVLMQHFRIGQDEVQLVVTAFMVANTIAMLPSPWLIERFGLRRCFLAAIAVLAASCVLGALSPNFAMLVAVRVLQGAIAGLLLPIGTIVVMHLFPADEQGRAAGLLGFSVILAPAVAPALGGLMIDHLGWQSVFLMSLPFCALAWLGAVRYLPLPVPRDHGDFDWVGMAALSLMTLAMLGGVSSLDGGTGSPVVPLAAGAVALLALASFLRHTRSPRAIVTRDVLRWRPVAMGLAVSFVYGFSVFGASYVIPVFLQTVRGLNATQAGGMLVPGGLALAATLPVAGLLADRIAPHLIVLAGLALVAAASLALWHYATFIGYPGLVWLTVGERVGIGLLIAALNQAALRGLRGRPLGQSAMIVSYARMLGGFLGVALLAVFIERRGAQLGATPAAVAEAFAESFLLLALVNGLAMVAAWRMKTAT